MTRQDDFRRMLERDGSGTYARVDRADVVLVSYIECALWASTDEDGEPLDGLYSRDDLAESAVASMREDVVDFLDSLERDGVDVSSLDDSQIGHDLWLTRNRHGAGFWDRGLGALGDDLTKRAHAYGESDLYVGDDGALYVTP